MTLALKDFIVGMKLFKNKFYCCFKYFYLQDNEILKQVVKYVIYIHT